ncbi:methionine--tRNA ligase [Candidatus Poribacteria bacterium]|nr:methionine--tRNA ligase [Candidatus Poribacteria bacterium]MYB63276.1 methionine--tRNA ligase [Candidatus Poribacteria bacterium]MYF55167.1 methionine--tRNA ligase [Candidatus Poribacteria bacterium]
MMNTFYVTTPIYYPNSEPHAGNAYTTIAADVLARYHRLKGYEVCFLTGVDEHAANVLNAAKEEGLTPQEYCDKIAPTFVNLWERLNISHDIFFRTTSDIHKRGAQKFLNVLYENGDIYKDKYEGYYCISCEKFFAEKELTDDKICPDHKIPLQWLEEENYFFRLSKYADRLLAHFNENPDFVYPETRRNELLSFLESGLQDISISRASLSWGIPFPFDPEHIIYIWIEALSNYITALGYETDSDQFQTFWPADVHMMGKDITRFHALFWPAMLMAADLPLPKHIVGHGWLTKDGEALSKTRGIFVDMDGDIATYGVDAFRYYLLREFSFGNDGDYRPSRLHERYNADLANDLGNLLNRVLGLLNKNFDVIPEPTTPGEFDDEIKTLAHDTLESLDSHMQTFAYDIALETIWEFVRRINRYVQQTQVWTLAKPETKPRMGTILYNSLEALRFISALIFPFIPDTADKIQRQIGSTDSDYTLEWGRLKVGQKVAKGEPIFPRVDLKKEEPPQKTGKTKSEEQSKQGKTDLISFTDFQRMDLRVGCIISAESIQGADRLLKLIVDIGTERRQVVAGIAEHYRTDSLIGKQVIVVVNLEPATIRNVESQGMVLAASSDSVVLTTPETEVPLGTQVR